MKGKDDLSELKAGAGIFGVIAALVLVLAVTALFIASPAKADHRYSKFPDEVITGINSKGLYVQGAANETPANITVEGIGGFGWVIYPIGGILLALRATR